MALDIGEKRIGVAVSDTSGTVATPLAVLDSAEVLRDGRPLVKLLDEYEVTLVIVGLPLSLDGTEGPQAARVRTMAGRLARFLRVPVDFADERLSSVQASKDMQAMGSTSREQRGQLDMVAASLFLQSYLDARRDCGRIGDQA